MNRLTSINSLACRGIVCAIMIVAAPANTVLARDLRTTLAPVTRGLNKFSSDVCHSLKLKCTRTARTASRKTATSTAIASAAQHKIASAETPPPVPRSKPLTRLATTQKPPQVPPPIPRKKPAVAARPDVRLKVAAVEPKSEIKLAKPATKAPQIETASLPPKTVLPAEAGQGCLASLRDKGVKFEVVTAPLDNSTCRIDVPVRLHAIATPSGLVSLPEAPVLNCQFANQFSRWLAEAGSAVVYAQLNTKLAKVSTGPGYECRGRNGDKSAKLSEHGYGGAVDITTITTADGNNIRIADAINPASPSYELLRSMRATACGYFTTVLGPGANEAHKEHYHFDLAVHGKSGNYRICQ